MEKYFKDILLIKKKVYLIIVIVVVDILSVFIIAAPT